MSDINRFLPTLFKVEGGYCCNPADKGNATNLGITLKTYKSFYGSSKTVDDLKKITYEEASLIYKREYWDKLNANRIGNQSVANILVDFAVNSGVTTAIKHLQNILLTLGWGAVKMDGLFGPVTLSALNSSDQKKLFELIILDRQKYYEKIVMNKPSQKIFLKGWLNRLNYYKFADM